MLLIRQKLFDINCQYDNNLFYNCSLIYHFIYKDNLIKNLLFKVKSSSSVVTLELELTSINVFKRQPKRKKDYKYIGEEIVFFFMPNPCGSYT